jgi:hypothetical protein
MSAVAEHVQRKEPERKDDPDPIACKPFHRSFLSTKSPDAAGHPLRFESIGPIHSAAICTPG